MTSRYRTALVEFGRARVRSDVVGTRAADQLVAAEEPGEKWNRDVTERLFV